MTFVLVEVVRNLRNVMGRMGSQNTPRLDLLKEIFELFVRSHYLPLAIVLKV